MPVIDYALPVYFKYQTQIARLENTQYRAAKLVTGAEKCKIRLGFQMFWDILGLTVF